MNILNISITGFEATELGSALEDDEELELLAEDEEGVGDGAFLFL